MKRSRQQRGKVGPPWFQAMAVLPALALLTLSCIQPADEIIARSGATGLVFVKETSVKDNRSSPMRANPGELYRGSDLYLLSPISPSGELTNLTAKWTRVGNPNDWGAAADPEVSFDGKRILFSMREAGPRSTNRRWQIYELDLESGQLTVVTTPTVGDDMDPAYLDDTHTRIVFGSTRNQVMDEYERQPAPQLFIGERSGPGERLGSPRQITFNQSHDQNPMVHSSGRIFFSRWDHLGSPNKIPLFTVNPDGSQQFVLFGADELFPGSGLSSGQRVFLEPRELSDGGLVTSMMERTSPFEGGAIAIIDLSRFTAPPEMITPSTSPYNTTRQGSRAIFKTPYPIMDDGKERILVAQSAREVGGDMRNSSVNFDLAVMDKDGKNLRVVHSDPNTNDYDPVVVAPRMKPAVLEPKAEIVEGWRQGAKTGIFFTADVYSRMANDGHMQPKREFENRDSTLGQAKFYRFLEAVALPVDPLLRGVSVGNRTEFEKQRVIGYGDIRADGSFSAEVPANTPLHLQVLDEEGLMLVNQLQWINVMPGERRICTGCHGPRDQDTHIKHFKIHDDLTVTDSVNGPRNYFSGFNNAQKVTAHPAARTDTVDFTDLAGRPRTNTIQHIFNIRCNSCHGAAAAASGGGLVLEDARDTALTRQGTSSVYETLTRREGAGAGYRTAKAGTRMPYLTDDGARNNPLAWVLYNRQLTTGETLFREPSHDHSTLWKKDAYGRIDPFAAENADLLTLIEWMDMGIQFANTVGKR